MDKWFSCPDTQAPHLCTRPLHSVCGGNINQDALRLGSVTTFRARSLSFAMPTPFTSANSSLAFHPVGIPTSGYLRLSDVLPSLSHRHTGRGDPSPPQQAKTVSSQADR